MTTTGKIALGILGAAAVGMVLGLQIAPGKGSDTRRRIRRTTGEWADNVGDLFRKANHKMKTANEALAAGATM